MNNKKKLSQKEYNKNQYIKNGDEIKKKLALKREIGRQVKIDFMAKNLENINKYMLEYYKKNNVTMPNKKLNILLNKMLSEKKKCKEN